MSARNSARDKSKNRKKKQTSYTNHHTRARLGIKIAKNNYINHHTRTNFRPKGKNKKVVSSTGKVQLCVYKALQKSIPLMQFLLFQGQSALFKKNKN